MNIKLTGIIDIDSENGAKEMDVYCDLASKLHEQYNNDELEVSYYTNIRHEGVVEPKELYILEGTAMVRTTDGMEYFFNIHNCIWHDELPVDATEEELKEFSKGKMEEYINHRLGNGLVPYAFPDSPYHYSFTGSSAHTWACYEGMLESLRRNFLGHLPYAREKMVKEYYSQFTTDLETPDTIAEIKQLVETGYTTEDNNRFALEYLFKKFKGVDINDLRAALKGVK